MDLPHIPTYLRLSRKLRRQHPHHFDIWGLIRFFPVWQQSLNQNKTPLIDEQPWITFSAIHFLKKIIKKNMHVFEYGIGGSTLFFAKRVKQVISVEHDPVWKDHVANAMQEHGYRNWQIHLVKPTLKHINLNEDPSDPDAYISADPQFQRASFKNYAAGIDQYPDQYFDIILIDGRARPSCFTHALPKIKKNGYIVWDNTDRPYYFPAMQSAPPYLKFLDFPGPSPYVALFTRTSMWHYVDRL